MINILRAADHKSMPWKNGGGVTTEIAVSPEGAGLEDFDWRISMARVKADGLFSSFPEVDRTLAVLEGNGIALSVGACEPVLLTTNSDSFVFAADEPTQGTLRDGPILDLNVMVRRRKFRSAVRHIRANAAFDFDGRADRALVLVNRGRMSLRHDDSVDELTEKDCVLVEGAGSPLRLNLSETADIFLIELFAV